MVQFLNCAIPQWFDSSMVQMKINDPMCYYRAMEIKLLSQVIIFFQLVENFQGRSVSVNDQVATAMTIGGTQTAADIAAQDTGKMLLG